MSLLEEYVQRCVESDGLMFQKHLTTLRNYVKMTPENEVIFYIMRINKIDQLRLLWAVGLPKPLQEAVTARADQLRGTEIP